jgi:hypothetical protein
VSPRLEDLSRPRSHAFERQDFHKHAKPLEWKNPRLQITRGEKGQPHRPDKWDEMWSRRFHREQRSRAAPRAGSSPRHPERAPDSPRASSVTKPPSRLTPALSNPSIGRKDDWRHDLPYFSQRGGGEASRPSLSPRMDALLRSSWRSVSVGVVPPPAPGLPVSTTAPVVASTPRPAWTESGYRPKPLPSGSSTTPKRESATPRNIASGAKEVWHSFSPEQRKSFVSTLVSHHDAILASSPVRRRPTTSSSPRAHVSEVHVERYPWEGESLQPPRLPHEQTIPFPINRRQRSVSPRQRRNGPHRSASPRGGVKQLVEGIRTRLPHAPPRVSWVDAAAMPGARRDPSLDSGPKRRDPSLDNGPKRRDPSLESGPKRRDPSLESEVQEAAVAALAVLSRSGEEPLGQAEGITLFELAEHPIALSESTEQRFHAPAPPAGMHVERIPHRVGSTLPASVGVKQTKFFPPQPARRAGSESPTHCVSPLREEVEVQPQRPNSRMAVAKALDDWTERHRVWAEATADLYEADEELGRIAAARALEGEAVPARFVPGRESALSGHSMSSEESDTDLFVSAMKQPLVSWQNES